MKTINDYIIERIRIDNVKRNTFREFPLNGGIKDIEGFLKDNGFTQIKCNEDTLTERGKFLNSKHGKYYIIYNYAVNSGSISFTDTSNGPISKTNPMYYINPKTYSYRKLEGVDVEDLSTLLQGEFKKEMENYFG